MSDSPDIALERSYFIGIVFHALLYGIELYMYFHSVYLLMGLPKKDRKASRIYLVIGGLMLVIYAFAFATDALYGQMMWIEHRDFPGGPVAWFAANLTVWYQTLGTTCSMLTNWLGDGMLLYRCSIIWDSPRIILVFPALLYMGSIAMGIMTIVESARPGGDFLHGISVNFGVPWISLSVALNAILTVLICSRIVSAHQRMKSANLPDSTLSTYTGIVAILVESSLPFSILGIVFAIVYGKNLDETVALAQIWGVFTALSPQFIILRVASGRAWSRAVTSHLCGTSLEFAHSQANTGIGMLSSGDMASTAVDNNRSVPSQLDGSFYKEA